MQQTYRHRRDPDRISPSSAAQAETPRSQEVRNLRTWASKGHQHSSGVPSFAANLECGGEKETHSKQSLRSRRVSRHTERLVSAALHDVVGTGKHREAR